MKKLSLIAVVFMVFFSLAACGSGDKVTDTYNNKTDYSGEQGYQNWYYLYTDSEMEKINYMIFDTDFCTWRSDDENCLIEYHIAHPGELTQAVYAWKAPASGSISYTMKVQRRPVDPVGISADGVYVYITAEKSAVDLDWEVIESTDLSVKTYEGSYTVSNGEFVYFVLNSGGNYIVDQTYFDITVKHTYAGAGSDKKGLTVWAVIAGAAGILAGGALIAVRLILNRSKKNA